jgi:hypothetical protein
MGACIRNEFAIKRGGKNHTNNPNKQSIGEYDCMHVHSRGSDSVLIIRTLFNLVRMARFWNSIWKAHVWGLWCFSLFLSLIFCKQEEKLLFFGSVSGCTCLILGLLQMSKTNISVVVESGVKHHTPSPPPFKCYSRREYEYSFFYAWNVLGYIKNILKIVSLNYYLSIKLT